MLRESGRLSCIKLLAYSVAIIPRRCWLGDLGDVDYLPMPYPAEILIIEKLRDKHQLV
jgi:hypothetical protein